MVPMRRVRPPWLLVAGLVWTPIALGAAPFDLSQKPDYAILNEHMRQKLQHLLKNDRDMIETREALKRLAQAGLPPFLVHKSHIGKYGVYFGGEKEIYYAYLGNEASFQKLLSQFQPDALGTKEFGEDWKRWGAFFSKCSQEDWNGLLQGSPVFSRLVMGMDLAAHPEPRGVKIVGFHGAFSPLSPSLRVGDILLRLEREPVRTPDDVRNILKRYGAGSTLKLMGIRPSTQLTFTLAAVIPDEPGSRFAPAVPALADEQILKATQSTERLQSELSALDDMSPEALHQRFRPRFTFDKHPVTGGDSYLIWVNDSGTQAPVSRLDALKWLAERATTAAHWAEDGKHDFEKINVEQFRISWQYLQSLTDDQYAAELQAAKNKAVPSAKGSVISMELDTSRPPLWFGVHTEALSSTTRASLHLPGGLTVKSVEPSSPAEKGGLRTGDLLLKMEHTPLKTPKELDALLQEYSPGSRVKISILRNGKSVEVFVTLETRTDK